MTLEQLSVGYRARITRITADEALKARMIGLGLRRGREVVVIRRTPLRGPLQVRVGNTEVIIRRSTARHVNVIPAT